MFIKKRNQYLLLENIKQAKSFLLKKGIDIDNKFFNHIIKSLSKFPNLVDPFTRMIFSESDHPDQLMGEFDRIIDIIINDRNVLSKLHKNINQYKRLEELADDISIIEAGNKYNKFLSSLYRSMRDEIKSSNNEELLSKLYETSLEFMSMSDKERSQFTPLKYFKMNNISLEDFVESLSKFVHGQDLNENKKRVKEYIENNKEKVNITYNKDNVLVIQTSDKESVVELGSQKWCIVYAANNYYDRYVSEKSKNTQYIIYNFNLPTHNVNSMYGVTIKVDGEIKGNGACQDKNNRYVDINEIYQKTGIPKGTLKSKWQYEYNDFLTKKEKLINFENGNIDDLIKRSKLVKNLSSDLNLNYDIGEIIIEIYSKINKFKSYDEVFDKETITNFFKSLADNEIYISLHNLLNKWYFISLDTRSLKESIKVLSKLETNKFFDHELFYTHLQKDENEYLEAVYKYLTIDFDTLLNNIKYKTSIIKIFKNKFSLDKLYDDLNLSIKDCYKIILIWSNIIDNTKGFPSVSDMFSHGYIEISTDDILNFENQITELIKEVIIFLDNGLPSRTMYSLNKSYDESSLSDLIETYIKKDFDNLVNLYMTEISDFSDSSLYISNLRKFEHIIGESFFEDNLLPIMINFYDKDTYNVIEDFIVKKYNEGVIDLDQMVDDDYLPRDKSFNDQYMEVVANFLQRINFNYTEDGNNNKFLLFLCYKFNKGYDSEFKREIGLKYNEQENVWYTETEWETLGKYFETEYDFENWEHWDTYIEDGSYNNVIDELDLENIIILAHYFKDNGFIINIDCLEKYEKDPNNFSNNGMHMNVSYTKSMELYQSDSELKSVVSMVESIITEGYDHEDEGGDTEEDPYENIDVSEIQEALDRCYSNCDTDARQNEYHDDQISQVCSTYFEEWEKSDGIRNFGKDYLRWNDDSTQLLVIPDLDKLLDHTDEGIDGIMGGIKDQQGEDFDIEGIINAYEDYHGKLSNANESGYVSWTNENYEYFNERFNEELSSHCNIDYDFNMGKNENLNSILKFGQYISEKNIDEIDNKRRFLGEFNTEEDAIEDLKYYTETIEDLNNKGGEVYRLVFLKSMEDLNTDDLGEHWCVESTQLSNFYETLRGELNGLPYLIVGHLKPNQINMEMSYSQYEELPHELEVNLTSEPYKYSIKPYRDTSHAEIMWGKSI